MCDFCLLIHLTSFSFLLNLKIFEKQYLYVHKNVKKNLFKIVFFKKKITPVEPFTSINPPILILDQILNQKLEANNHKWH